MNNQTKKPNEGLCYFLKTIGTCLMAAVAGISPAFAGQAFTGKIVIDGKVYEDNNADVIKGNGIMGKDKRNVSDFHAIKVLGSVNVRYQRADSIQVEVTGDQNLLPIIKTEVNSGILIIDSTKSYQAKLPLTVQLTSPSLSDATVAGASDINLQGLKDKTFNLHISGSGNATAEGTVEKLTIRIGGSGDVDAKNLQSSQADVNITGSGDISVYAKDLLKASITGSGDIGYFGHPKKIEPRISGSGDIEAGD